MYTDERYHTLRFCSVSRLWPVVYIALGGGRLGKKRRYESEEFSTPSPAKMSKRAGDFCWRQSSTMPRAHDYTIDQLLTSLTLSNTSGRTKYKLFPYPVGSASNTSFPSQRSIIGHHEISDACVNNSGQLE